MSELFLLAVRGGPAALFDRVTPPAGSEASGNTVDPITLMAIVGGAIFITVLARYLSRRGRK